MTANLHDIEDFLADARERMDKAVEHFHQEILGIRSGRASAGLIENVRVDYYGQKSPLSQIAAITVPEPRCLVVKPYDPSAIKDIERAIVGSNLGLTVSQEGGTLRIVVPPLSEEQRKKLAAHVKALSEEAKVALRNVRRDVLKHVEAAARDKDRDLPITDDDLQLAKEKVQEVLKEHEAKVDELLKTKTEEILEV